MQDEEADTDAPENPVPMLTEGQSLEASGGKLLTKKTKPPTRFSEASLVRELENRGIGRPATFAAIVDTILKREYVRVEKRFLVSTPLGEQVVDLLTGAFSFLDFEFTKTMEASLDAIAEGKAAYKEVMTKAHAQLMREVSTFTAKYPGQERTAPEPTDFACKVCGKPLVHMKGQRRDGSGEYDFFACSVGRGKYLLSRESYDNGPWRIARTPVQFAVEHGLLLDKDGQVFTAEQVLRRGLPHADLPAYGHAYLDEEQSAIVLQEQLGKKFGGFDAMSQERKVLASAFLAYAAGDKHACMNLLDAMSASYTENEKQAPACPVLENATFQKQMENLWNTHKTLLDEPILKRHAVFELPLFMAMLTLARRKGVLASSQFLWLRPLDRPLWYALNQCGGRAAWAEGFAAWAQYAAEEKAGTSFPEARTAHAVQRLKDTLAAQGWFTKMPKLFEPTGLHLDKDVVFAAAEENSEYDANNDLNLLQEY